MKHPVKKTEMHVHILRAVSNPKPLIAAKGTSEMWFPQWLSEIEDQRIHASLAYYLQVNNLINQELYGKA